jgi:hypothetical protein
MIPAQSAEESNQRRHPVTERIRGGRWLGSPRDGLDLSTFRTVVIRCRRFTVGFGVAPI